MGKLKKTQNEEMTKKLRKICFPGLMVLLCIVLYAVFETNEKGNNGALEYENNSSLSILENAETFIENSGVKGFTFTDKTRNDMCYTRGSGDDAETLVLTVFDGEVASFVLKLPYNKTQDLSAEREEKPESDANDTNETDVSGGNDTAGKDGAEKSLILGDLVGQTPEAEKDKSDEAGSDDQTGSSLIHDYLNEHAEEEKESSVANETVTDTAPVSMYDKNEVIEKLIVALNTDERLGFSDMEIIRHCIEEAEETGKKCTEQVNGFDLTVYPDNREFIVIVDSGR